MFQHFCQVHILQTMDKENPILASFIKYNVRYKSEGNFSLPQIWCGLEMGKIADTNNMKFLVYFHCLLSADYHFGQKSTKTSWD
jgi:hypothetical protein